MGVKCTPPVCCASCACGTAVSPLLGWYPLRARNVQCRSHFTNQIRHVCIRFCTYLFFPSSVQPQHRATWSPLGIVVNMYVLRSVFLLPTNNPFFISYTTKRPLVEQSAAVRGGPAGVVEMGPRYTRKYCDGPCLTAGVMAAVVRLYFNNRGHTC